MSIAYPAGPMPLNYEKIRELRIKLGLSQQQAAELAGIGGKQNWYKIETGGRPNLELNTLEAIARTLGVKVADLLK